MVPAAWARKQASCVRGDGARQTRSFSWIESRDRQPSGTTHSPGTRGLHVTVRCLASAGEPEDFELLRRWRDGDAAAGNALVARHYPSVRRFFDVRLNRLSEDLTQRTFLACVEKLERGATSSFRAYLFGIARRQMLMHLRKEHRSDRAMQFEQESTFVATSLTGVFAKQQEQYFLLLALVQLPTDLLHTVQLFYWEDLSIAEVGQATETIPSTVASRLARARQLLAETLRRMSMPEAIRASVLTDVESWTRSLTRPPAAAR